jgi:predicted dehydrogenase
MKIRLGMIGGGPGSFIGAVHRKAAAVDGHFELVCGAFSSNADNSQVTGKELGLAPSRIYANYEEMIFVESSLPADERMQAVSIVTPNHLHMDPAIKSLENGFHVIIDKPIAFSLEEALRIESTVKKSSLVLALTHTYAGYPMVKEARALVKSGKLGEIRKIFVEYPQGWLSTFLEKDGQKQASWRTDPRKSGAGGSIGDIGTHAAHLAEYISGQNITQICADISIVVEGRKLDDDAAALLRFANGASGVLIATQVAAGEENDVKIRVYGEKGGIVWTHPDANSLQLKMSGEPVQILRTGNDYLSDAAKKNTRFPAGHPEGYLEAFANIYTGFAEAVRDHVAGKYSGPESYDFPSTKEGVRGMAFIETMLASSKSNQKWTDFLI